MIIIQKWEQYLHGHKKVSEIKLYKKKKKQTNEQTYTKEEDIHMLNCINLIKRFGKTFIKKNKFQKWLQIFGFKLYAFNSSEIFPVIIFSHYTVITEWYTKRFEKIETQPHLAET